jgi:hypothetical protein
MERSGDVTDHDDRHAVSGKGGVDRLPSGPQAHDDLLVPEHLPRGPGMRLILEK